MSCLAFCREPSVPLLLGSPRSLARVWWVQRDALASVRHLRAHLPVEAGAVLLGDTLEVGHKHPALDLPMGALHAGVQQVNFHQVTFIYQGHGQGKRQPPSGQPRLPGMLPKCGSRPTAPWGGGDNPIPLRSGEGTRSLTLPQTPMVLPLHPSAYWEGCRHPSWAVAAQSCPNSRGCSGQRRRRPPRRTPHVAASAPAGSRHSVWRGGKTPVPSGTGAATLRQCPPPLLPPATTPPPRDPPPAPRTVSRTSPLIFTRKAGRRWKTCSSSVRYPRRAARACSRRAVPRTSASPLPAHSTTT